MTKATEVLADELVDLDAVLEERRNARRPLSVRLFRKDWELPGTAPAAAALRLYAWLKKGWIDDDGTVSDLVPDREHLALLMDLVPKGVFDEWCSLGLDVEDVEPVITRIVAAYEGRLLVRAEGEAAAPARGSGSRTSSNGGARSKRTSSASTGSRSRTR